MTHRAHRALALLAVCIAAPAAAQNYPTESVRFIVAYAPGGGTDVTARPIAAKLSERWGQSVFVDNRAGGNGMIGADIVAQSAPDCYTVPVSALGGPRRRWAKVNNEECAVSELRNTILQDLMYQ